MEEPLAVMWWKHQEHGSLAWINHIAGADQARLGMPAGI
jgi:hypothetical protein